LVDERIAAHDVAILICNGALKDVAERTLQALTLPRPARFGRLEDYSEGVVTVDTVARFKGLEREVIILWGFDGADPSRDRETLYVGMSRAKAALYLCGTREACAALIKDE
jgi:superfamily I DNA/RNA helicase